MLGENMEFVSFVDTRKGKKLLKVFKSQRAANMFLKKNTDKILSKKDIESVGTMSKKEWDTKEAKYAIESVNESKDEVTPKQLLKIQNDVRKVNRKIKVYISKHPVTKGRLDIELGHGHDNDEEIHKIYAILKKHTGSWRTGTMFNESVNESSIKGRNNKTGEAFGMVIGSDKKNREGNFEVTIRKTYSSRISAYGFVFDKDNNLISVKDYGYSMDGKFPDMSGSSSVSSVRPNKRETITQIAKITSPAFAKKIYQHVNKVNESVNEGKYNYKADALTAYFKGKIDAKELDKIARDDFKSGIATKKELSNFLSNKFTQDVMSDTYGIPAGTLIKRVRGLMKFAESIGESVNEAYIVTYAKKKGEKPASAAFQLRGSALSFERDLKKDGYTTMITQKKVKGVDEANRGKVHKAAKKGSFPAVIVVVQNGKVIHQEPVSTPEVAPATFNVIQKKYPKATIHLEDKTGQRLFSESVNENISQITKLKKQVGNNEIKFYDALSKIEKKLGNKYVSFLDTALKSVKQNPSKYKTNADKEEKLFQLA